MRETTLTRIGRLGCGMALLAAACSAWCVRPAAGQQRAFIRDPDKTFNSYVWSYQEIQRRRIVMQQRDYSCGAATLATIVRYYWGDDVNENTFLDVLPKLNLNQEQLKDRIENGLTLTDLRDISVKAGYDATMGKLTFAKLAESKVPLIVGIKVKGHDHFAVFRGTDWVYAYLADPIRGNVRTVVPDFVNQWQKNAVLVVAKPNTRVKEVNPLGVRMDEVVRGSLNTQYVHRNELVPVTPWPIGVGP